MFLEKTITIPTEWSNESVGLVFRVGHPEAKTNHEGLISIDDIPYHGIDRNRSFMVFPKNNDNEQTFNVKIELFNPAPQPLDRLNFQNERAEHSPAPLSLLQSDLVLVNSAVENLLFTLKVYFETARLLANDDLRKTRIVNALTEVADHYTIGKKPEIIRPVMGEISRRKITR